MIPRTILKEIFRQASADLGINFIREDQAGNIPAYPYGTYKQISNTPEGTYQNIKEYAVIDAVPSNANLKTYQKSFSVVSISVFDKTNTDALHEKLGQAVRWFQTYENIVSLQASGVTPRNRNVQIQDRSFFNENFYVGRLGFDLGFDFNFLWEQTFEAVETITIESEVDDVPQDDIIIDT